MCLYPTSNKAETVKTPIICYKSAKLVQDCRTGDHFIQSLYQKFKYILGKTYIESAFESKIRVPGIGVYNGFHSYKEMHEALKDCRYNADIVLRCEIPAGAKVYEDSACWCSNVIKITGWWDPYKYDDEYDPSSKKEITWHEPEKKSTEEIIKEHGFLKLLFKYIRFKIKLKFA